MIKICAPVARQVGRPGCSCIVSEKKYFYSNKIAEFLQAGPIWAKLLLIEVSSHACTYL